MTDKNLTNKKSKIRCAIYTRKSCEEGLEQDFNSLDAQREACESYIKSQQHEGWVLIEKQYNDGGFSGGNLDRPALKELFKDIERVILDNHSYETPQIVAYDIVDGYDDYLNWIGDETI